jgi:hypothetical protein
MPSPLKTWISNFWHIVVLTVLVAVLVVFGAWYGITKLIREDVSDEYFNNVQNIPIKTYSLGGTVESANFPKIMIKAGQVVTQNGQNNLVYKTYTASVTSATEYKKYNEQGTESAIDFASIGTGDNITVYTAQNPYDNDEVTVSKIEIR